MMKIVYQLYLNQRIINKKIIIIKNITKKYLNVKASFILKLFCVDGSKSCTNLIALTKLDYKDVKL